MAVIDTLKSLHRDRAKHEGWALTLDEIDELITMIEQRSQRYIEAEELLNEISSELIVPAYKINEYFKTALQKYNF